MRSMPEAGRSFEFVRHRRLPPSLWRCRRVDLPPFLARLAPAPDDADNNPEAPLTESLRPEQSISGISQPRHDVRVLVEAIVERGHVHRHIGVLLLVFGHALG